MPASSARRGGSLGIIVGFLIGIPATVFALSNLEPTRVEFLGWESETPLWAVIALSLTAGLLLGVTGLLTWQARRRRGKKKAATRERQAQQVEDTPQPGTGSGHGPEPTPAAPPADSVPDVPGDAAGHDGSPPAPGTTPRGD